MAKPKKRSKVQKRAKLRRSAKRGKARKASKSARAKATKRTVARAKPNRATVKKPAQRPPSALVVETVVVEKPAPDLIIVPEGLDPAA